MAVTRVFDSGHPYGTICFGQQLVNNGEAMADTNLIELGENHWRMRVFVGRNAKGQSKWASKNFRGTKRQARAALAQFKADLDRQEILVHSSCSVAELLDRWLAGKKGTLTPKSYKEYARTVERDLKPAFGKLQADKLTSQHLDHFYRAQLASGLAPTTVRKQHAYMSGALKQAVKWGILPRNQASNATAPSTKHKRIRPPKVDAVRLMMAEAERTNPLFATALAIGAVTGARRGELCALRWSHIDWPEHTLSFEESVTFVDGEVITGDTKTHQWRTLSMDAALEDQLRRRRAAQEEYARQVGCRLVADPYILSPVSDGSAPYKPDSLSQAYWRVAKRVGIKSHIHELRHFAATTAIASGADVRTVAGRLGHAQTSTTLDIYADALEQRDRELADVMGAAVFSPVDGGQKTDAGDAPAPA